MSRKSDMSPYELRLIIGEVYGHRGQRQFASDMGRGEITVSRWLSGTTPIGELEAKLIRLICVLFRQKVHWQKLLKEYRDKMPKMDRPLTIEDLL